MGRKHIKTPSNLKEIGLQDVQIPDAIKQAFNDITVLMYHINQVATEYDLILKRHKQAVSWDVNEDEFYDSIRTSLDQCLYLYEDCVNALEEPSSARP